MSEIIETTAIVTENIDVNQAIVLNIGSIDVNYNTFEALLERLEAEYSKESIAERAKKTTELIDAGNIELVHEALKDSRRTPADLRRIEKNLKDYLVKVKKEWNAPLENFESAIKQLCKKLIDKAGHITEVEVEPLDFMVRDHRFNNFVKPILDEALDNAKASYPQVNFDMFSFSNDKVFGNLTSKKADILMIARQELDSYAIVENERIQKQQIEAQRKQRINERVEMWELKLEKRNTQYGTSFSISQIINMINSEVQDSDINGYLDQETDRFLSKKAESEKKPNDYSQPPTKQPAVKKASWVLKITGETAQLMEAVKILESKGLKVEVQ